MSSSPRIRRRWTDKEDQVLNQEAESQLRHGNLKDWNRIALKLPGRTNKDCRKRWSKIGENIKKGPWSCAEDEKLRGAVRDYGLNWTQIALNFHTRNADQCAKRWQHSLDPNLDHSEWTGHDDDRVLAAVTMYGRNWKTIRDKNFPGRSTTDIKNRHSIVIRRQRIGQGSSTYDQAPRETPVSLETTTSVQINEHSHIQESEDDEDTDSLSSNFDLIAFENNSLSATSEARRDFGSARDFPDFDHGAMLESLQPFDLGHQHSHGISSTYPPMTESCETGLQDSFLSHNSAAVSDVFAIDHQWNEEAIALYPDSVDLRETDAHVTGEKTNKNGNSRTVLTLYNVEPGTLSSILDTAFRSKTKLKMETYH